MKAKKNEHKWGDAALEMAAETQVGNREILVHEPSILEKVSNRIYFYADIERSTILKLNQHLRDSSNEYLAEAQMREIETPTPLFLHIHSYGGSLFAGLAGMDEVRKCKVPVYTVVDGCCASAATFLSVVGTKRYMNRHSFMLIHQLSSFFWGKYEEFKDEMENMERLMAIIKRIYGEFTKVPMEELEGILKHDLWFDADKCLEYGLVDEIL